MQIHEVVSGTFKGKDKEENEDRILIIIHEKHIDFCIIDGMGGEKHGKETVDIISQCFVDNLEKSLHSIMLLAQMEVFDEIVHKNCCISGAVLSCIRITDTRAEIFHIGDTRIFTFKNNQIKILTKDQNVSGMKFPFQWDKIRFEGRSNILTSRMGGVPGSIHADFKPCRFFKRDIEDTLLCITSDGIHDLISEKEMILLLNGNLANEVLLGKESQNKNTCLEKIKMEILSFAKDRRGGHDDGSIILIRC